MAYKEVLRDWAKRGSEQVAAVAVREAAAVEPVVRAVAAVAEQAPS